MAIILDDVNQKSKISSAEFVRLTVYNPDGSIYNGVPYTFSTSYKEETISGTTFTPLGGLLGIGTQQRDLAATSYDTTITLVGVDPDNIYLVLNSNIRGATIEIARGFYDGNGILKTNGVENTVLLRYTGIVTGYTLTEDRSMDMNTYTITINCSNYKTVLENQIPGRYTNPNSWNHFYPSDTSMYNVPNLYGASFDFGMKK
jgi:hypothetical protein